MEEASLFDHLTELRTRLIKSLIGIFICFLALVYFSNDIYEFLAEPLQKFLPINSSMIAFCSLDKLGLMIFFVAARIALIGNNNNKDEKPKIFINFLFLNCIKLV